MTDELDRSHLLYKKIGASVSSAGGGNADLRRAFRMVIARAAEDFSGLLMVLRGMSQCERAMDELVEDLADVPVVFALEGPGDTMGMAIMDHQLIAGLLEHVTTGRVVATQAEPRPPTRTDANLCADFVDRTLQGLALEFGPESEGPDVSGYRYGFTLPDARAVEMAFENMTYHVYDLALDLDGGAKNGTLKLILPDTKSAANGTAGGHAVNWADAWAAQIQHAPVALEALLGHKRVRLADVSEFTVGHVIKLDDASLANVTLIGQNGQIVARGKLGRQGSEKAIRVEVITDDIAPEQPSDAAFQPGTGVPALPGGLPPPPAMPAMAEPMPAMGGEAAPDMMPPGPIGDMGAPPLAAPMGAPPPIDIAPMPAPPAMADPDAGAPLAPLPMGAAPMPMAGLPDLPSE